ncbi:TetR family transcriptional regulator C-terminal domain-containing protein [Vibrio maerlii]|uniref:TetR family transcriptional regulator C-terminal domain-containing protein n=1 Tax=Vibrio maerlii TaxID=2231648 RepID=UPI000E3C00AE|nr:TetR family transcriptional regulator C-terminal domain-containing protein [Vibrio maerlii]
MEKVVSKSTDKTGAIRKRNQSLILNAAAQEFAKHGYKGTSLQVIADRVELPKANILYYFKSKTGLYKALLSEILNMWNQGFSEQHSAIEPSEVIGNYIREKMCYSRSHPLESKIFAMEIIQGAPVVKDILVQPMVGWSKDKSAVIQGWIDAGKLKPIEPLYLLFMIWGTTQFYADFNTEIGLLKGRALTDEEFYQAQEFTVETILRGLGLNAE